MHFSPLPTLSHSSPIRHSASAAECYHLNGPLSASPLCPQGEIRISSVESGSVPPRLSVVSALHLICLGAASPEESFGDLLSHHNCFYTSVRAKDQLNSYLLGVFACNSSVHIIYCVLVRQASWYGQNTKVLWLWLRKSNLFQRDFIAFFSQSGEDV